MTPSGKGSGHKNTALIQYKDGLSRYRIAVIKVIQSRDHLIFLKGISYMGEMAFLYWDSGQHTSWENVCIFVSKTKPETWMLSDKNQQSALKYITKFIIQQC